MVKYCYAAVFTYLKPEIDGEDGILIEFPDLPGCLSQGEDQADALSMAQDVLEGWIKFSLEDGRQLPQPSSIKDMKLAQNQKSFMIEAGVI